MGGSLIGRQYLSTYFWYSPAASSAIFVTVNCLRGGDKIQCQIPTWGVGMPTVGMKLTSALVPRRNNKSFYYVLLLVHACKLLSID